MSCVRFDRVSTLKGLYPKYLLTIVNYDIFIFFLKIIQSLQI